MPQPCGPIQRDPAPSRLRGGRRETKKVIAREDGYTYIAALRSPDLRHTTKREGDTSVTSVTNNVSVSQCAGELLKRKGAPRETLPEYLATLCRPHIEAEDCSHMMRRAKRAGYMKREKGGERGSLRLERAEPI